MPSEPDDKPSDELTSEQAERLISAIEEIEKEEAETQSTD